MKHAKFLLTALFCLLVSGVCRADDTPISPEALPVAAKDFVKKNFAGKAIVYAEKDWNSFECRLNDGTKLEFNKRGSWTKVDCRRNAVPSSIVPDAILNYVKTHFEGCVVTKIDKERYGYELELSNDIDLKFSYQGAFLGMDD